MSLTGSLEIGKKALSIAQSGQSVTGHNIANANTEGYSRQQVLQTSAHPSMDGRGMGVESKGVRRIHDVFTAKKIIEGESEVGKSQVRTDALLRAEVAYVDGQTGGLSAALDDFWNGWAGVANEPEKAVLRRSLVASGERLIERLQIVDYHLSSVRQDLDSRIAVGLLEINDMAKEIAQINKNVRKIEFKGDRANDLRDKRAVLLENIASRVSVKWFENNKGEMEVQVGNGQALVSGDEFSLMTPVLKSQLLGKNQLGIRVEPGIEYDVTEYIESGSLKEMVNQRDIILKDYQEAINLLAKELAFTVNKMHASGTGILAAKSDETSAYGLSDESRVAPLPFLESGDLELKLVDEDNEVIQTLNISLEAGVDSLESIAEKINVVADAYEDPTGSSTALRNNYGLAAIINKDGSLTIDAGSGNRFIFGKDETNFLPVMGFNSFFHIVEGIGDMKVNQEILDDEMKISAGSDLISGDNKIALSIADLQYSPSMSGGSVTFDEFYKSQVTDLGLRIQRAQKAEINHKQMLEQFEAIQDSVSSVNIDEEMANMVMYQRAYEASAKFMTTVDDMTKSLINM